MNLYSENDKLNLFKTLFKGREDVFAIYWEKGNKSGYMPAYHYDPYRYQLHKMKGGTFQNFHEKTYLPLTDQQLLKHFNGQQLIGIYPLLQDNTSWFIAADFDNKDWVDESQTFINICQKHEIPAYLERSRSGKGGHVWIFFDQPYLALRSRKIMISLLEKANIFSLFDRSSSFDRLFPNQNFLSGKRLGNLIALPLFKTSLEEGNSCFVNENLIPYQNQWKFLSSIRRVTASYLNTIYQSLQPDNAAFLSDTTKGKLLIQLDNVIRLNRSGMNPELINFLKEELNFANSEYFIRKNSGKNTWGIERYISFIEESEQAITIPRGFIGKLIRYCRKQKIDYEFLDQRKKPDPITFTTNFNLQSHQKSAVDAVSHKEFGVIAAPPGTGKTVIGIKIIAEKKLPALIIVHRKQLLEQWIERIQAFLGIPKSEIGRIGQGKTKLGKAITIAMIQSLSKYLDTQENNEFAQSFGTLIVDECHHIPAKTYRSTISKFSSYYQYGITATPFRKGNDGKIIFTHLGDLLVDIKPKDIEQFKRARIIVKETGLDVPFNPKTDPFEVLSKVLIHDSNRNRLILGDVFAELNRGKKAVIITERKEHIDSLYQFLKQSFEVVTLSGDDSDSSRKTKWQILFSGNYQALITTGQLFGEGTDLQNASCIFLVYPFSFKGKLIQYIGRVQRSEFTPVVYDYRDSKIEYLNRLFLKRNKYYRNLDRQATLFDDSDISTSPIGKSFKIEKKVKIPIAQLDFQYGAVSFSHREPELEMELKFEVENDAIRPEFDVLKPYFSKVLNSKYIGIEIFAEFEDSLIVAQEATSADLEKINREIIESVKFRFIEKDILGKKFASGKEGKMLDLDNLQADHNSNSLYSSEEQLLKDILKEGKVKHYRQLMYLASRHDASTLKIRFVLNPFSFVFLIPGLKQNHIVLETLDTEEATYIWHIDKNKQMLSQELVKINQDLNIIRNKGRHSFLKKQPENFSRLVHNYSDERKGFIVWKDQFEERLF